MLRLDPAAPPLWRTPTSLQLGWDPPLAVLPHVTAGTEVLVDALVEGADREHLDDLADRRHLPPGAVDDLLAAVAPALEASGPARGGLLVDGPDDLAAALGPLAALPPLPQRFALLTAHHVLPPARSIRWLAEDVPHLPVVFADQAVVVGPLVVPGVTPCLRCADEHRLDAEPRWPAIAGQLLARPPARTATLPLLVLETVGVVAAALRAAAAGTPTGLEGRAVRLRASGPAQRLRRPWHRRCACRFPATAA
ncbi:hypothetical protein QDR37_15265 [Amnibacterium sp. CER49]|uniref:hypothetical protein n=1 Tax=Amnibacterium sp. CER49 TaxID=3039161 RepID=UPI002447E7CA|nr:hypothetical protein [Amnibacterium sp. CER49]MDH2445309.1 hypothetical protein [Amnibacterium sp. CER49]